MNELAVKFALRQCSVSLCWCTWYQSILVRIPGLLVGVRYHINDMYGYRDDGADDDYHHGADDYHHGGDDNLIQVTSHQIRNIGPRGERL